MLFVVWGMCLVYIHSFLYILANEFKIEHFLRTANRLTQWYWESDGVYSLINVIVSK